MATIIIATIAVSTAVKFASEIRKSKKEDDE